MKKISRITALIAIAGITSFYVQAGNCPSSSTKDNKTSKDYKNSTKKSDKSSEKKSKSGDGQNSNSSGKGSNSKGGKR